MYQNRLGPSGGIYYPNFVPCFVYHQLNCAPQNDHLNLIFEKKRKEMTRNVCKMVIYEVTIRLGESDFIFTMYCDKVEIILKQEPL